LPASRLVPLAELILDRAPREFVRRLLIEVVRAIVRKFARGLDDPLTQIKSLLFVMSPLASRVLTMFSGQGGSFVDIVEMFNDDDLFLHDDFALLNAIGELPDAIVYWNMIFGLFDVVSPRGGPMLNMTMSEFETILINTVPNILIANQTSTIFHLLSQRLSEETKRNIRGQLFVYASENFSLEYPDKVAREIVQAMRRGEVTDEMLSQLMNVARERNNLVFVKEMMMLDVGREAGLLAKSLLFAIETNNVDFV
jgi:hypothetical protein